MFNFRDCMLLHTNFADDVFDYYFNHPIIFKIIGNCYVSEKVDVKAIFDYCKKKYNYQNNDMNYFDNMSMVDKMEEYNIYFDINSYKFIIPLESVNAVGNIILFGKLNDNDIKQLKIENNTILLFESD